MASELQFSPSEDRPRVEVVEEIPSPATDELRAFIAGAVVSGVLCAIAGATFGFVLGARSREEGGRQR